MKMRGCNFFSSTRDLLTGHGPHDTKGKDEEGDINK